MDDLLDTLTKTSLCLNKDIKVKKRIDGKIIIYNFEKNQYCIYEGIQTKILDNIFNGNTLSQTIDSLSNEIQLNKEQIKSFTVKFVKSLIENGIYEIKNSGEVNTVRYMSNSCDSFSLDEVFLELTKACNLNCHHCYVDKKTIKSQLDTKKLFEVIDQLDDMSVLKVKLTGGEPMLHPDFYDIINYIKEKKIGMRLYTNGSKLDKKNIKKLVDAGIKEIQISLDGFTSRTHDQFRRTDGNFDTIMSSLPILDETGISIILSYTATEFNIDEINLIGEYVRKFKNIQINISPYINYHSFYNKIDPILEVSYETINKLRNAFYSMQDIWSKKINYGLTFSNKYIGYCGAGIFSCYISAEGDVGMCPLLQNDKFHAGNLNIDTLKKIWNKSYVFNRYRQLSIKDLNKCNVCTNVNNCRGGCRARAFYTFNNLLEPDPVSCQMYNEGDE